MSTEPAPHPEAHEANSKKKLQPATRFSMDRKPGDLAGRIMYLPGGKVKGIPSEYGYRKHPVVILSPSMSVDKRVEILGMTSFNGKHLAKRFRNSHYGMEEVLKERAKYLPIEPSPAHPDTPETNVTLKMFPSNPKEYSYVDTSSRQSIRFKALQDYTPFGSNYGVHPRFYLDKDSYQKLAAFVGFSTAGLFRALADPEVEEQLTEQLAGTGELESSLPSYDANIPLLVMSQQAKPETAQAPGANDTPIHMCTQSRPTSPASSTPSVSVSLEETTSRQEFDKAFHRQLASQYGVRNAYSDSTHGALDLSKPARNNIRIVLAFVATLVATRALSRSTLGREVLKEAVAGVKAMMASGVPKKLVVTMINVLERIAWAVMKHFGRNWGRYTMAGLQWLYLSGV